MAEQALRERGQRPQEGDRTGLARTLDAAGWGLLFIWIGVAWIAGFSIGVLFLGASLVVLGVQIARKASALSVEAFSVFIGLCLGVAGIWQLTQLRADVLPVLFILAGASLVISALSRSRRYA